MPPHTPVPLGRSRPDQHEDERAPFAAGQGPGWMVATLTLGAFVVAFDLGATAVAAPVVGDEMRMSLVALVWVVAAVSVAFAGPYPWIRGAAERLGPRTVLLWGIAAAAVGSVVAATSQGAALLLAGRALWGIGAAAFVAGAAVAVDRLVGSAERSTVDWSIGAGVLAGLVSGPAIGGLLVEEVSWRLIPLLRLPPLAVLAWLVAVVVPANARAALVPDDAAGAAQGRAPHAGTEAALPSTADHGGARAVGLTVAIVAWCVVVTAVPALGLASPVVLGCAVLGAVALGWWVSRTRAQRRSGASAQAVSDGPRAVLAAAAGWAAVTTPFVLALVVALVAGEVATIVGLVLAAGGVGAAVGAAAAAVALPRQRSRWPSAAAGMAVAAVGAVGLAGVDATGSVPLVAGLLALCGLGLGLAWTFGPDGGAAGAAAAAAAVRVRGLGATVGLSVGAAAIEVVHHRDVTRLLDSSAGSISGAEHDEAASLLPAASYSLAALKRMAPDVAVEVNEVSRDALASGAGVAMAVVAVVCVVGVGAATRSGRSGRRPADAPGSAAD